MQEPRGVSLESCYSTGLSVPTYRVQENHPARSLRHQEECKYCTSSAAGRGTDRESCKETASVIGGTGRRSATSAQPGNPRESEFYWRSSGTPGQVNASTAFFIWFLKMTVKERGFARMSEDVVATIWRLRETIRVAELAATHSLGQMRRLLMYEKHKTWKREFGFDRIETAAEMDEKCSRTSTCPVPDPFFYRNMVIPRRPHTPDEFTLEMKVIVEGLQMEIFLSQPASSQCDPSPRRAAVDTGSEGTRNAATAARDRYGVRGTRSIVSPF